MNGLQAYDQQQLQSVEWLIGIDEAGRGCLAGPVMAAACVLGRAFFASSTALDLSAAINDSKQLSARARAQQFECIEHLRSQGMLDIAVASGSVKEIAELNILGATRLAMRRAVEDLAACTAAWTLPLCTPDEPLLASPARLRILVDGRALQAFPYAHTGVVKGDGKSLAIAIASIVAKVCRDRVMDQLHQAYPEYGFARHKGYGTAAHRAALHTHGASVVHRELFLRKLFPKANSA